MRRLQIGNYVHVQSPFHRKRRTTKGLVIRVNVSTRQAGCATYRRRSLRPKTTFLKKIRNLNDDLEKVEKMPVPPCRRKKRNSGNRRKMKTTVKTINFVVVFWELKKMFQVCLGTIWSAVGSSHAKILLDWYFTLYKIIIQLCLLIRPWKQ